MTNKCKKKKKKTCIEIKQMEEQTYFVVDKE